MEATMEASNLTRAARRRITQAEEQTITKPKNSSHRRKEGSREKLFERTTTKPWKESARFVQLPRLIVADKQLSHGAIRLAAVLSCFDMPKKDERLDKRVGKRVSEGIVFPGNKTLCRAMGLTEPMVIQYKKELQNAGYLEERRRLSKSSFHVFKFPKIETVRNLVRKYRVFSVPVTADDFEGIVEEKFLMKLHLFFGIVKEVKETYRSDMESRQIKEFDYEEMEKTALALYKEDEKKEVDKLKVS